ncbi:saccharopine dehydrogenase (NAD+, L-lysine-forming) [Powellomyces hirtus]|uniref:Saccharopine dehydrogenase [NAD(+), L-lysine-forming] n=1 Tax=Powellomyces hirtus TaxID=109895 RepID=A0A507E269_9FUNG|nr:saccharopine dehydrogenase (NAD+, L-lysine-forming) [Powellomyces hirtus]
MTSPVHLWLRAETKRNERRTALTPSVCRKLIEKGYKISVEYSQERIFDDEEYKTAGCTLVESGSWRSAPSDAFIIGLKELPENDDSPLPHKHIMFAHCFKKQGGWKDVLSRFDRGGGSLYDLEFLNDENGRRVAAFGYYAGYAGAALGLDSWAYKKLHDGKPYPSVKPFSRDEELLDHVRANLDAAAKKHGSTPSIMVMGAKGRCGTGATDFAKRVGISEASIIQWDIEETRAGGPFAEIAAHDVFVNCIYLSKPIPPFLTKDLLTSDNKNRKLDVLVDVSCDTTNPHNPIPLYNVSTTFHEPVLQVEIPNGAPLDVITIDHLPSLVPREASEMFCNDLLPSLLQLGDVETARVWTDADKLFREKVAEMKAEQ